MDWDKDDDVNDEAKAFLTFEVGAAVFAVNVGCVSEILDIQPTKPIPGAPHVVQGMIDVRGKTIVTMDGPDLFDVPYSDIREGQNQRLVVFELADESGGHHKAPLAVRVDRVRAVESFSSDQIEPAPGMAADHIIASAKRDGDTILFVRISKCLAGGLEHGLFAADQEDLAHT